MNGFAIGPASAELEEAGRGQYRRLGRGGVAGSPNRATDERIRFARGDNDE